MNLKSALCQFRKDILEVRRDKRSLLAMILVPVVIVPGVIMLLGVLAQEGAERLQTSSAGIAFIGNHHVPAELDDFLQVVGSDRLRREYLTDISNHPLHPFIRGVCVSASDTPEDDFENASMYRIADLCQKQHFIAPVRVTNWQDSGIQHNIPQVLDYFSAESIEQVFAGERTGFDEISALVSLKSEIKERISSGEFAAVVVFHPDFGEMISESDSVGLYTVIYSDSEEQSRAGKRQVDNFFAHGARGVGYQRLLNAGLSSDVMLPVSRTGLNIGDKFNVVSRILPYFLVLTCFIGCVYPALDLIAGEKERGTIESLLLAPVNRFQILLGKHAVIVCCGLLSSCLCLICLSILVEQIDAVKKLTENSKASELRIILTIVILVFLSNMFAAIMMTVSVMANSYRQAQSYSMPVNLAVIVPALFSVLPGFELEGWLAIVPVVNISLSLRDLWNNELDLSMLGIAIVSTFFYTITMLRIALQRFNKETYLYRGNEN